jgi:hypothetical protein
VSEEPRIVVLGGARTPVGSVGGALEDELMSPMPFYDFHDGRVLTGPPRPAPLRHSSPLEAGA